MKWIDREVNFPDVDFILCYGEEQIFICEMIKTKWGNGYCSTELRHEKHMPEWTHWMPLPDPPSV